MISKVDYHQVFEETVMSVVEGLVKHADKADIKDLKQILLKWCDFYQRKITSSNNKYTASQATPKSCPNCGQGSAIYIDSCGHCGYSWA